MEETVPILVRIPRSLHKALADIAAKQGRSLHAIVLDAITTPLTDLVKFKEAPTPLNSHAEGKR